MTGEVTQAPRPMRAGTATEGTALDYTEPVYLLHCPTAELLCLCWAYQFSAAIRRRETGILAVKTCNPLLNMCLNMLLLCKKVQHSGKQVQT